MQIQVTHGHAESYWDVSFSPEVLETARISPTLLSGISVFLDAESGELILNRGYTEFSNKGRAETRLFDLYLSEVEQALHQELETSEDPNCEAFRQRMDSGGLRI